MEIGVIQMSLDEESYALTRENLDIFECDCGGEECDNNTVYLEPKCHPRYGTDVYYNKEDGCLYISCHMCEDLVSVIEVARKTDLQ